MGEVEERKRSYAEMVASVGSTIGESSKLISTNLEKQKSMVFEAVKQSELKASEVERSRNLMVFGITEASSIEETCDKLNELLRSCSLTPVADKNNTARLGRVNESGARPVRLSYRTAGDKWDALKRINSRKEEGLFARCDLNAEQRKEDFQLRQKLKTTRSENPEKHYKISKGEVIEVASQP